MPLFKNASDMLLESLVQNDTDIMNRWRKDVNIINLHKPRKGYVSGLTPSFYGVLVY